MTTTGQAIDQEIRDKAQGPHTIASRTDGGYFLRQSDLPTYIELSYDLDELTLMLKFRYEDDGVVAAGDDTVCDNMQFSTVVDGLRLVAFFSSTRRRVLAVNFRECNLDTVDAKHLAAGVASALLGIGESDEGLTPHQVLTLKALAVVFQEKLPRCIELVKTAPISEERHE